MEHLELRRLMAENGYEHTPAEAKQIFDDFSAALERLTTFESYLDFLGMTEEDMEDFVDRYNSAIDDKMTIDDFKEIRQMIIDIGEGN